MEGANVGQEAAAFGVFMEQREHAAAHFPRRFIGKGNGQNMRGVDLLFGHQISQAMREGLGLAGTGASQDQNRPVGGDGGRALGLI